MGNTVGEVWENYVGVDMLLSISQNMEDPPKAADNVVIALHLFVKYDDGDDNKENMNPDWSLWLFISPFFSSLLSNNLSQYLSDTDLAVNYGPFH